MSLTLRVTTRYRVAHAFLKKAFTYAEALAVLDFPKGSNPSEAEVQSVYRTKVREALKADPEQAKEQEVLIPLNRAKDVLTGKLAPDRDQGPPPSSGEDDGGFGGIDPNDFGFGRRDRPAPEPVKVTFEDAMKDAGVHQVDWKFKTTTSYGGYGDTHSSAFVIYGVAGDTHVFVAVQHYTSRNAFTKEHIDTWWMKQRKVHGDLRTVAPKVIRELFDEFPNPTKKYNAKVEILPEDTKLTQRFTHLKLRPVAFKDAMGLMGAIGDDDPWKKDRKLAVTLRIVDEGSYPHLDIEIDVNGKVYLLDSESSALLKSKRILDKIFGAYYSMHSRKVLTRAKDGKLVMEWMAKNLTKEPQDLKDALLAAAQQVK
jgi:hypothetical protein